MNISIVTFDEFTDLDLFILWDLLKRVDRPDWNVKMLGSKKSHVSSTGIEVKMHGELKEANSADAVIFCSGRGTRKCYTDNQFLGAFSLDENRQLIGAIDSGALFLGALGLITGKKVTTYPAADLKKILESMGAEVVWESFVLQGNIATAARCISGQYLAGWVIEKLIGAEEKTRALESVAPLDEVSVSIA